jgi:hypothetical protein
MRASLLLALALFGCATSTELPPFADTGPRRDAGRDSGTDAGVDAAPLDAESDADLDASSDADLDAALDATTDADLDAALDASLDASSDAGDAGTDAGPIDVGPIDAGISRAFDPIETIAGTPIAPFSACTIQTATDTIPGAEHRLPCDPIAYPFIPPSGGPHYSIWASFLTYASPVPWGFLVHSMEHGGVVLAYHCDNDADCDPVRAAYANLIAAHGLDPVCRPEDTPTRYIVVPAPDLPTPIAVIAWGHVYLATCLDVPSLTAFAEAHYGMATESLCVPGTDLSATGWCP